MTADSNSLLDQADRQLPALQYAVELQTAAASVGFDWPDTQGVIAKIYEELAELEAELTHTDNQRRQLEELGDLLFAITNLARHLQIDPQAALNSCNTKFKRRFHYIETQLSQQGKTFQNTDLIYLDRLWEQAKRKQ